MAERVGMNGPDISCCLKCGASEKRSVLSGDHMFPSAILNSLKRRIVTSDHPMHSVVNSETNLYRLCYSCHEDVDKGKISSYLREDPMDNRFDLLCVYLSNRYPITENDTFRPQQINMMIRNNRLAIKFARRTANAPRLFKRYTKEKVIGYKLTFVQGVVALTEFNQRLDWLRKYDRNIDF